MAYTIRPRYGTTAGYAALNRVYAAGELLCELGVDGLVRMKVADGTTAYNSLPYVVGGEGSGSLPAFGTISVPGQSNVVADTPGATATMIGSSGIALTTNAGTDTLTFAPQYGTTANTICQGNDARLSGGGISAFKTIAISGQSSVVADQFDDTLTMVGSTGIALTTNTITDTVTIAPVYGTTAGTICQGNDARFENTGGMFINARINHGAVGDGVTNDTTAIVAWINAVTASGGNTGYLPKGTYVVNQQIIMSLNACRATGATFFGDGVGLSIIDVRPVQVDPAFLVRCTSSPPDAFYLVMKEIGIWGDYAGTTFQLGLNDFSDPMNEPKLDLLVSNANNTVNAVAVRLNAVYNGYIRLVANCALGGVSLACRAVAFSTIEGSFGTLDGKGIYITAGYNYGNMFMNVDLENSNYNVVIDTATARSNVFVAGQFSYKTHAINCTAGSENYFISPNPAPVAPATTAQFIAPGGHAGVVMQGSNTFGVTTPPMAGSGSYVVNTSGLLVAVYVNAGAASIAEIAVNGSNTGMSNDCMVLVRPGGSIAVSYSGGTPSWNWQAVG